MGGRNLYFLVTLILAICQGFSQDLPPVVCPDNFAYLKFNDRYVGQVSVPLNGSLTENKLKVELSVRGVSDSGDVGEITFLDSGASVREKLVNNKNINFQMDLSSSEVLPKLTKIEVNGETICRDKPYDRPTTFVTRTLLFHNKNRDVPWL